jgi:hypothetical protein
MKAVGKSVGGIFCPWKECWRHILPVMNHTIMTDVKRFKEQHQYYIDAAVANFVHSLVQD